MAATQLFNLVRMTTATTGTGTITLGSAVAGFKSAAGAGIADGSTVSYAIKDGSNSEKGYGVYTASGTTLTRNVVDSTNSDTAISLSGSAQVFITPGTEDLLWGFDTPRNFAVAASVAGSALTVAIKDANGNDPTAKSPVIIPFRSATAATGTPVVQHVRAASSIVISSGSTMGTANSVPFALWLVLFDDGGTLRPGLINCVIGGSSPTRICPLIENLTSSTAEGGAGAADTAGVFYTGTAVTSKAYRILARLEWASGLGTAGTWSSGPTTIDIFGPGKKKPGDVVEYVRGTTTTVATGTTVMFADDTIPQNTEGDQYLTQDITPSSAANVLQIFGVLNGGHSASGTPNLMVAIFENSNSSASAAMISNTAVSTGTLTFPISFSKIASTVSQITFKMRAGSSAAGTTSVNGSSGFQLFGGVLNTSIMITEIQS